MKQPDTRSYHLSTKFETAECPLEMTIPSNSENDETNGYERLGKLMGRDGELSIFRRFGALSAERLLHRQAELRILELELRRVQEEDRNSGHPDRQKYHRNFGALQRSRDHDAREGNDPQQLELLEEIDHKMAGYHEALLRHQQIMKLQKPTKKHVAVLREWMDRPDMGSVYLIGPDRDTWDESNRHDLAIMTSDDFLTSRVIPSLISWYNEILGRHIHKAETDAEDLKNTIVYNNDGVFAVIKALATLLACVLLMTSIAVLYAIHDMKLRIGITAVFTFVFAISINLTTDAKIKDIFGATAAFAAVLVVFIGTNDSARDS